MAYFSGSNAKQVAGVDRYVISRLLIPAFGFASIGLLAILYIHYPYIYDKAMTAIMAAPFSHPFVDWEYIPSVIRCWTEGVNVYVNNPMLHGHPQYSV